MGENIELENEAESCLARGNRGERIYEGFQIAKIDIPRKFILFLNIIVIKKEKKCYMRVILTITQTIKYLNSRLVYILKLVQGKL